MGILGNEYRLLLRSGAVVTLAELRDQPGENINYSQNARTRLLTPFGSPRKRSAVQSLRIAAKKAFENCVFLGEFTAISPSAVLRVVTVVRDNRETTSPTG